jgi:hypothetical protein
MGGVNQSGVQDRRSYRRPGRGASVGPAKRKVFEPSALSPVMALRVEKAFGVSMDTLMRMQNSYDIAKARKREGEIDVRRFTGRAA